MIETHAHIYDPVYQVDINKNITDWQANGVKEIWMPNCDSTTIGPMLNIAKEYSDYCLPMLGLHPCYVKENYVNELNMIEKQLSQIRPLAIGEIGMDLFWDKTFVKQQEEAFLTQCNWALSQNLWIDIHSRNAFWETVSLIEKIGDSRLNGVFHCFTGTYAEATKAIELGFMLGIGGVVTFKNSGLDSYLSQIDLSYIVLETDSPYLAPVPFRGKTNNPSYLSYIVKKLSDIYQISEQQIIDITTQNALNLKNRHL